MRYADYYTCFAGEYTTAQRVVISPQSPLMARTGPRMSGLQSPCSSPLWCISSHEGSWAHSGDLHHGSIKTDRPPFPVAAVCWNVMVALAWLKGNSRAQVCSESSMIRRNGGSPGRCAPVRGQKDRGDTCRSGPGRGSSAETKDVVQVRVRVHVTHRGQVNSGFGIGTDCYRQRLHHRISGKCQLVPGEGPRNDEARNMATLWGSADSVRSGWVRESGICKKGMQVWIGGGGKRKMASVHPFSQPASQQMCLECLPCELQQNQWLRNWTSQFNTYVTLGS